MSLFSQMVAANQVFGAVQYGEALSISLDVLERETSLAAMWRTFRFWALEPRWLTVLSA
jgi:hypothetical protein